MEIKFKPANLKIVAIDSISPNPWNPKDKNTDEYKMIVQGIEKKGLQAPIFVREYEKGYQIVDGEQRWRASGELGAKEIIIYNMGAISDQEAKEMTLWFEHKVPFNQITLAHLLSEMKDLPDLVVPFTKEQLENFNNMAKFNWENYRDGELEIMDIESEKTNRYRVTESQLKRIQEIAEEGEGDEVTALMLIDRIKMKGEQKAVLFQAIRELQQKHPDLDDGSALESLAMKYIAKGGESS